MKIFTIYQGGTCFVSGHKCWQDLSGIALSVVAVHQRKRLVPQCSETGK